MRFSTIAFLFMIASIQGSPEAGAFQDQTVAAPREEVLLGTPVIVAPLTCENLALYILEDPAAKSVGDFITLEEGLKTGKVRVSEQPQAQVNELLIENVSTRPCFVQAGDVVKGGQQDRAIASDLVVPPRSGRIPVRSFCVEHGRWSGGGGAGFGTSTGLVMGARLRAAIQKDRDQEKVWKAVEEAKKSLVATNSLRASQSTSLNEQMEDKRVRDRLAAFWKVLGKACDKRDHAVGLVTAINGKLSTADVYGDPVLFRKLFPRLLASAALEAISAPAANAQAPSTLDVSKLLAMADKGKPVEEAGSAVIRESNRTLQFRCLYDKVELHRQSLVK